MVELILFFTDTKQFIWTFMSKICFKQFVGFIKVVGRWNSRVLLLPIQWDVPSWPTHDGVTTPRTGKAKLFPLCI